MLCYQTDKSIVLLIKERFNDEKVFDAVHCLHGFCVR